MAGKKNLQRRLEFHGLQIALDLLHLKVVQLQDPSQCPLAKGSRAGLKWVRMHEDSTATIQSLSRATGRAGHEVQTTLCEYDKYVSWSKGLRPMRRRRLAKLREGRGACLVRWPAHDLLVVWRGQKLRDGFHVTQFVIRVGLEPLFAAKLEEDLSVSTNAYLLCYYHERELRAP